MSEHAMGVKKVPFDGTKEIFYLWSTQLLCSAATHNYQQAILGTAAMPKSTDALDETNDADKKLLLARKINATAMCLFQSTFD
jgi:hypothetical protein